MIKKFNDPIKEPNEEIATANKATSVLPGRVYLILAENGVTKAQPGRTSALSDSTLYLLFKSNKKLHSGWYL